MPSWGGAGKGAMTGATIGSFIPGIGSLIGGGVGALFGGLFGGGGEPEPNPEDQYTALLGKSAQANQSNARELGDMGASTLAPVAEYFKQLTSQNPAGILDATRQDRGRVIDQYDTARKAVATFAPRGGGSTSVSAQSQFDQATSLADITSTARRDAMSGSAALGTSLTGLGLSAQQLASADLNSIISAVLAREGLDTERRGQNMGLAGSIGETIGTLVGIGMGGDGGGGGGAPYMI